MSQHTDETDEPEGPDGEPSQAGPGALLLEA